MKKNKNIWYIIICVLILIVVGSTSYAAYLFYDNGEENYIDTGVINFNYIEDYSALEIVNSEIVSDSVAMVSDKFFEFTVTASATGKVDVGYYIYLTTETLNNTTLDNNVKFYLTSVVDDIETPVTGPKHIGTATPFDLDTLNYNENSSNKLIHSGYYNFNNDSTAKQTTYRFRMWLDENYVSDGYQTSEGQGSHVISSVKKTYKVKINVLGVDGKPITITN